MRDLAINDYLDANGFSGLPFSILVEASMAEQKGMFLSYENEGSIYWTDGPRYPTKF
jgi:hypothetical protein